MKPRRPRRPFVSLDLAEVEAAVPGNAELFLGRFSADALRRELTQAGVLSALDARGYRNVRIETSLEAGEHRLRILASRGRIPLVDLRLAEASMLVEEPAMRRHGLEVLSLLSVHWLSLQNPRGRFTPERPRLPGQNYPGLGLSRLLYTSAISWAQAWGKDGLANFPEYFHNAVFYSAIFRFLSPEWQGRFEALGRDLGALAVAEASAAIEDGRVLEEPGGAVFEWQPGEMVVALGERLRTYLDSPEYRAVVDAIRDGVRYLFSPPQSSHGHSPRNKRKL